MWRIGLLYSLIAGIMSMMLIWLAIQRKSDKLFLFSLLFLIISWSGIEWTLWLLGENLFSLVFQPIVPLASYFVAWTVFVVYLAEKYFKRVYWAGFLGVVALIIVIAHFCMDCI